MNLETAMKGPRKTRKDTKPEGCDVFVTHPPGEPEIFSNPSPFVLFVSFVDLQSRF